jgi:hypothetical protein
METRNAAVAAATAAVGATQALLGPLMMAYQHACTTFLNTPAGPAKGAAGVARNTARVAIQNAAAGIQNPDATRLAVVVQNFPLGAATPVATVPQLVADMILLRPSYKVVLDHGHAVGDAFVGTGAPAQVHNPANAAQTGQAWPGTAPAGARPQRTRTTFGLPPNATLAAAPAAAAWTAIQHFPADNNEPLGIGY